MFDKIKAFFVRLLPAAKPLTEIVPVPNRPTLRKGSNGGAVKELQRILKSQGFFDGSIYGNFADLTYAAVVAFQQTHVNALGSPLIPDGVVGPDTWWALYNHSGKPQETKAQLVLATKSKTENVIPRGITGDRAKVLNVALGQLRLGIREIPNGSNTGGEVTKFHEWFGMKPLAWCAMSFCWIVFHALGSLPWKRKLAGVSMLWSVCKNQKMAFKVGEYRPVPGDACVWLHSDGTGHIGIILCVDGSDMIVLEGNSGNAYKAVQRQIGAKDHAGYLNFYGDLNNRPPFQQGLLMPGEGAGSDR